MRKFGGFFNYLTSRWSLACFAVALILNRVTIYGSTRRHLSLRWHVRLALRIVPIVLFVGQIIALLQAIRCQTSPKYPQIRYGKPGKLSNFDYGGQDGFLHSFSSFLLPWQDDEGSCDAVHMKRLSGTNDVPYGSFSLLWPVFLRLCLNQFVETLSCALQGRGVATEAGMSIFEHSLAFAEAETMISQSIGLGLFGASKSTGQASSSNSTSFLSTTPLLSRSQVLDRFNVFPELLLIALISCCNCLSSNLLDVFGRQSQTRLIHTTFWGLCFMASVFSGFFDSIPLGNDLVLKFPTVCIVGFVPHLLIFAGILTCLAIYGLALTLTAFSLPSTLPRPTSLRERFSLAHANMQGASQIQNVHLNPREDFYAALVRIGYASLAAASDAVFLSEGRSVVARPMTWLEEDRLSEIEALRSNNANRTHSSAPQLAAFSGGSDEAFNFDIPKGDTEWESGYSREKKIEKQRKGARSIEKRIAFGGVGAFQGASRCYNGFTFFRGIFILLVRWAAFGCLRILDFMGITRRPRWLTKLGDAGREREITGTPPNRHLIDFWILTDEGELKLPEDFEFDVEKEMRKRELANVSQWGETEESRFDRKLYIWWKIGGSWGERDESGDFEPSRDDREDTTSVVSSMSSNTEPEWEAYESDGCPSTTRNERDTLLNYSLTPSTESEESLLDMGSLARLLDPRDSDARHEAQILASHLMAADKGKVMTRSRFRSKMERDRARVLTSSRYNKFRALGSSSTSIGSNEKRRPTSKEEEEILENLILSLRLGHENSADTYFQEPQHRQPEPESWKTGASGLGADGPQCVICQAAPRSIIVWPCRCLCVCEDCRVSLAMNNFGSCVTCRREVVGFVRLWVP
ncbi:ubiquitin-protein ligase [Histoplasma capsulatum G186AR]|uniref:Ubiquitin-protein ligase n=1 Tax=Ajellomyces capsulatus TaxID=5037 RepID=A0A8H7Z0A7_AJECA|nr:ubiquitin-protein ligase [Histoplasma capsulatum]QSS67097.1 ubiquitin-protein ligase [Histoplasma capsulatum G186AR]